jgi:hypothetical protein
MKQLRAFAGSIRLWFRCVRKISVSHAWKLTLPNAFPCGPEPFALLVSPITVPFIFALRLYEQYNIQKIIETLKTLNQVLDEIMAKKKTNNTPL